PRALDMQREQRASQLEPRAGEQADSRIDGFEDRDGALERRACTRGIAECQASATEGVRELRVVDRRRLVAERRYFRELGKCGPRLAERELRVGEPSHDEQRLGVALAEFGRVH